ncbi:MAG: 2-keto-4-pentenoate hydratase [Candidatus Tectimicrobiota bacterium]
MQTMDIARAAAVLWHAWQAGECLEALPVGCRPAARAEGYAIQAQMARLSEQTVCGWKIAATSTAGQGHIGVDGPLAGRLLQQRVYGSGAQLSLHANRMRVAEAEFAFRLGRSLPPRAQPYTVDEVREAVDRAYPAIEVPDSRYRDFASVGAPQLIADNACADWFVLGEAVKVPWRTRDLVQHRVTMQCNGRLAREGLGANVLGDPWLALAWLANELATYDAGLLAGQVVTTGTCIVPLAVLPGDRLVADFGDFGRVEAVLT